LPKRRRPAVIGTAASSTINHLALPYARAAGKGGSEIVLYPHFSEHIVPGWLDKSMAWRRAARGPHRSWLDNVLIVAPSPEFLRTLPTRQATGSERLQTLRTRP
jgi:hypothetical protein